VTRFKSVVLDVDSTLSGVEGIDWLASLRGEEVEMWSADLTAKAMDGVIPIEAVYSERMRIIKPTSSELDELGDIYLSRIAPGAKETLAALRAAGIELAMVSGGLREAILPLARELGVDQARVRAVSVFFGPDGSFAGFEESSSLTRQRGKQIAVQSLALETPILAVGDGITDLDIRPVVQSFAAYTGFAKREQVVQSADFVIDNFDQLRELVLG
jgi:phosphoserine phosphatase